MGLSGLSEVIGGAGRENPERQLAGMTRREEEAAAETERSSRGSGRRRCRCAVLQDQHSLSHSQHNALPASRASHCGWKNAAPHPVTGQHAECAALREWLAESRLTDYVGFYSDREMNRSTEQVPVGGETRSRATMTRFEMSSPSSRAALERSFSLRSESKLNAAAYQHNLAVRKRETRVGRCQSVT